MFAVPLALVVVASWTVFAEPLNQVQHSALMDIYNGLGCNTTTCRRFALVENCVGPATCSDGNVTELRAFNKQLTGTISSSIRMLTALTNLYLNFNQLSGTLTSYIGQLTALNLLSVETNQFNGTIPKQIAQLTALTFLCDAEALSDNRFNGTIPTQIAQLTALTYLYLSTNQLSGTIPTQFAQLRTLDFLYLYNNRLTGPIPPLSSTFSRCNLQLNTSNDANCLDCSTAPSMCMADCFPRTCPPKPMASTTTPAPTTQQTSSSSTPAPTTQQTSSSSTTSMSGGMSSSSAIDIGTTSTSQTTSGQIDGAMSATQPSDDNTALIGGVVGGVVALLIVVGVIAFIVLRNRKAKANPQSTNDGHSFSPQPNKSNYDRINGINPPIYDDVSDIRESLP